MVARHPARHGHDCARIGQRFGCPFDPRTTKSSGVGIRPPRTRTNWYPLRTHSCAGTRPPLIVTLPFPNPKETLLAHGLRPKRSFGQNFLCDAHLVDRIALCVRRTPLRSKLVPASVVSLFHCSTVDTKSSPSKGIATSCLS